MRGRGDPEHDVLLQVGFILEEPADGLTADNLFVHGIGFDVLGVEELGGRTGTRAPHGEREAAGAGRAACGTGPRLCARYAGLGEPPASAFGQTGRPHCQDVWLQQPDRVM
jgi:hypothetical protein